jgi:hypothetical protein
VLLTRREVRILVLGEGEVGEGKDPEALSTYPPRYFVLDLDPNDR